MSDDLHAAALDDHRRPAPAQIAVMPVKVMAAPRDLPLAHSRSAAEA